MKRCPACQRTYAEESATFCLDDGTPLLNVEPGPFEPTPTAQSPDPSATGWPTQPIASQQQPYYNQSMVIGFRLTNKIIGISGAVILILGIFMPIISVLGFVTFSLFTFIQGGFPTGPSAAMAGDLVGTLTLFRTLGIIILLLGACALLLALKNQLKPLMAIGIAAIAVLAFIFIKLESLLSTAPPQARAFIGVGWGFFAMVAAAVLLIVAGVRREKNPLSNARWGG